MVDYESYTAALVDVLRDAFADADLSVQQPAASTADFTPRLVPHLRFADGRIRVDVYAAQQPLDDVLASGTYVPPAGFSERSALVVDLTFHSLKDDDDYYWNTRGLVLPDSAYEVPKAVADVLIELIDILRDQIGDFEEEHINTELRLALASYNKGRTVRG